MITCFINSDSQHLAEWEVCYPPAVGDMVYIEPYRFTVISREWFEPTELGIKVQRLDSPER